MTEIVYRVQDKDGRGPWKPGFSNRWVEDRTNDEFEALKPWIHQFDERSVLNSRLSGAHLGCGCRSLDQLRRWFLPGEYATLLRYGYAAVQLDIGRILAESDIQCIFERAHPLHQGAVRIELYSPAELRRVSSARVASAEDLVSSVMQIRTP